MIWKWVTFQKKMKNRQIIRLKRKKLPVSGISSNKGDAWFGVYILTSTHFLIQKCFLPAQHSERLLRSEEMKGKCNWSALQESVSHDGIVMTKKICIKNWTVHVFSISFGSYRQYEQYSFYWEAFCKQRLW